MTDESPSISSNLEQQVADAGSAIEHDAATPAAAMPRPTPAAPRLALVLALVLLVVAFLQRDALRAVPLDRELAADGSAHTIALVASFVRQQWDSTGTLPRSLVEVGLGDLPITYEPSGSTFLLRLVTPHGDTLAYQSPPLDRPAGATP